MNRTPPLPDPARLASLSASGLLDTPRDPGFEKITSLAAKMLRVPVCLISLVDEDRQVFIGACGLPQPYERTRETPLSHSFCQHVVSLRRPLVIRDARSEPLVAANGAVRDLGVIAYLGFPLIGPDQYLYGAFCAIDTVPREWTEEEQEMARDFTALVAERIELNAARQQQRNSADVLIHDLKSPLAGIRMLAGNFADGAEELPPRLRILAGPLVETADKALHLVESLARRDHEGIRSCGDLCGALRRLTEQHRPAAEEKGIRIDFRDSGEALPLAAEDWAVEQIAENLLSNAVKFSNPGGTVRIFASRDERRGIFEVADEGPGFREEDYPRLFQRYVRLSARPTAAEPSTGLGLSIVKRLAEQEGGRVTLLSPPGESAVFRVELPLAETGA